MEMKYDNGNKKKLSVKFPMPDASKEQSIAEIFKLNKNQAPDEDHLIKHNALSSWGKKPNK